MTVQELINLLSKFDPETPVVTSGYEGGVEDCGFAVPVLIDTNSHNFPTSRYVSKEELIEVYDYTTADFAKEYAHAKWVTAVHVGGRHTY